MTQDHQQCQTRTAALREAASLGSAAREPVREVKMPTQITVVGMLSTALLYS